MKGDGPRINEARLQAFLARALHDLAATQSAALVVIGDRLGLYRAMARSGALTPGELAERTGTDPRYVREWLINQAAGGYVEYDPGTGRFKLPEEQALALAAEDSRAFVAAAFQLAVGLAGVLEKVETCFRTGGGLPASEYAPAVLEGMFRASRVRQKAFLLSSWIPALDGVAGKLEAGASVADVGCGRGAALALMAEAFPRSRFVGFDTHAASIEWARAASVSAGCGDRLRFEVASATSFPGEGYDLVTCFECLHDLGDPLAAARRIRSALAEDGTWMIVEPFVSERVEDNLDTFGRLLSSVSTLHCLPVSIADGGVGQGSLGGEGRVREIASPAGFTRFRKAAESPFACVLEVRP